jgi:hypothetical protein
MQFKVTFEASGFTNSKELVGQACSEQEAKGYTEVSLAEKTFPKNVLAVLGGRISDDDEQGERDIHVFVCVDLLVEVSGEEAAERVAPPIDLLTKISDLMSRGFDLDLEAHSWEVTEFEGIGGEVTSSLHPECLANEGDGPRHFHSGTDRWTFDRGAMPGEPFALLDVADGDLESAVAVMREVQVPGKGVFFEVVDRDGGMLSTGSSAGQAATLAIDRLTMMHRDLASGARFDPTHPHNYARIRTDKGLQLEYQDGLDSHFGERIVDVRNALFEAGWDAQPYKWPLTKGELTLSFQAMNVGAGKNVVGGDWVVVRAGAPWASPSTVPDLLTQSFYGLALAIDDVAEQAVERMAANRLLTPQELTVEEFAEVVSVTRLQNHGRKFDVAFGASCSAFSDALKPGEAVKDVHRAMVNNALYAHSAEAPDFMEDMVFPPDRVLDQYPEFKKTFADVFAKREIVSEGSFSGQILSVSDGIAVQKTNRDGNTVRHAMSSLNAEVIAGTVAEIQYQKGTGVVAPAKGQLQGPGR